MARTDRELRILLGESGIREDAAVRLIERAARSVRLLPAPMPPPERPAFRARAVAVDGILDAVAVAGSGLHRLVLRGDGSLLAWGENAGGQLGDGTRTDRTAPVGVRTSERVKAVAAGVAHSLALTEDGRLLAWGANDHGQLGAPGSRRRKTPVVVCDGVVAMAAGAMSSVALLEDGSVVGCGFGVRTLAVPEAAFTPIAGLERIVAVAAGEHHWLALGTEGLVQAWGGGNGTLGDGSTQRREAPVAVRGLRDVIAIAAGDVHSLALQADGTVYAWGRGSAGVVGALEEDPQLTARAVSGLGAADAIAAGHYASLAVVAGRGAFAWGWNLQGQLGDLTDSTGRAIRFRPVAVAGAGPDVVAVAPRTALRADGAVLAWGDPADDTRDDTDDAGPGASKLGGAPDLPVGAGWPSFEGRPMAFIAQVALADVVALDEEGLLPAEGILSLFHSIPDADRPDAARVIHTTDVSHLDRLEPPAEVPATERLRPVTLHPVGDLTLAPPGEDLFATTGLSEPETSAYCEVIDSQEPPIHRMLGHPDVVQNDPRVGNERLLMQIDDDEAAGMDWGAGRLYILIEAEDLRARRFDRVRSEYQQT